MSQQERRRMARDDGPGEAGTPRGVIEAAQAKADAGNPAAALALLTDMRGSWSTVPPAYDAALGRMSLLAGHHLEAISHLEVAKSRFKTVPAALHRLLGLALLSARREQEAGCELSAAIDAGLALTDLSELMVVEDYRAKAGRSSPIDYRYVPGLSFADLWRGVQYTSIPKNACTILKAMFVMNSPLREKYLESRLTIHEFYATAIRDVSVEVAIARNPARVVVLRDPESRLVSAYLNKIVRPAEHNAAMSDIIARVVRAAQTVVGLPYDRERSISFAEFVRYLTTLSDAECDVHWVPQHRLCGTDMSIYAHVGRCERLDDTMFYLKTMFGMEPETSIRQHIHFPETHTTIYDEGCTPPRPWNVLPKELRSYDNGYPPAAHFFNDEIRAAVRERYATDFALYAAA